MAILNLKNVMAVDEVFSELINLRRFTGTSNRYNELNKQAMNCIVAYIIACYCEKEGKTIHWERFPKIAIYMAFQKANIYYTTPKHVMREICEIGNIKKSNIEEKGRQIIEKLTNLEFREFICSGIGTYEMEVYKAATKIATYIELIENQLVINKKDFNIQVQEILEGLSSFSNIPGVKIYHDIEGDLFGILMKISKKLRNSIRFPGLGCRIECSVLGHLFDTAVFAYFNGLEKYPNDEKLATNLFFMGIFHDVPEVWTTDIPSNIKDAIPKFRKATEIYELKKTEENLYKVLPEFLEEKIRMVMFEDDQNLSFKKLIKGADYLSSDSECHRQYEDGTRKKKFLKIMRRFDEQLKNEMFELTPTMFELHKYFLHYAENLNL